MAKTTKPSNASPASGASSAENRQPTEEMIRLRAYQIFQSRNGAPGDPAQDWRQAEAELRAAAGPATRQSR